jgi:hypothetical protein
MNIYMANNYIHKGCYKDKKQRAIPTQLQNITSIEECAQLAQNKNATIFGVQNGNQCFIGNNLSQATKYGSARNCAQLGGYWTNQVYEKSPNTSCKYKMNNVELQCYKDSYPDLVNMTNQQLQTHWSNTGCNQSRNNQCPPPQQNSGNYQFKGCYNDNSQRAIPNYQGNNMNIDKCQQIALSKKQAVFGMQYGGECWTGNDVQQAYKYGINFKSSLCGSLGGVWTNMVYAIDKPYPPPVPPIPSLSSINFAEKFTDKKYNYKYIILFFIIIFIALMFLII